MARGYQADIPDEVPSQLMAQCLAPSYKAICLAILRHDVKLESLGFHPARVSAWEMELRARARGEALQFRMFRAHWLPERSTTLRYKGLDGAVVFYPDSVE